MATAAGNPSAMMGPAERARQLGLQSDGSGGYIDPETGQTVAKTVNGELVFYDNNRATGGAISDSSNGAQMTQAAPSFSDPMTGMVMVPPSRPESEEEIGAVPDSIPAQAPHGYNSFMNNMKMQAYEKQANATANVNNPMQAAPVSGINPIGPSGGVDMGPGVDDNLPGVSEALGDNADMRAKMPDGLPKIGRTFDQMRKQMSDGQPEMNDRQKDLAGRLDRMNTTSNLPKGAGANALSMDDIGAFRNYIKNGPQNKSEDVSPEDMDWAMGYLKQGAGKKWGGFQNRLKGKGDPAPERKIVSRAREVVESYLRNMGQSSIDGSDLPFSESELDHGISLSNGGLDQGDNWRWLPKRFNQFKGDLDDDALLAALDKEEERQNNPDFKIKQQGDDLTNFTRSEWKDRFETDGWENMNVADIREKKGTQGLQFLKALAEKAGVSYYKNREGPRESGRAGGGTSLGVEELQDRLIDQLGIPDNVDVENFDRGLFEVLQRIEDQRSDLDSAKRARRAEKRAKK